MPLREREERNRMDISEGARKTEAHPEGIGSRSEKRALTGTTVLNRFVGHRKLGQVVTNHISLFGREVREVRLVRMNGVEGN